MTRLLSVSFTLLIKFLGCFFLFKSLNKNEVLVTKHASSKGPAVEISRDLKCVSSAHRDLGVVRHCCPEKSLIWHFAVNNTFAAPGGT